MADRRLWKKNRRTAGRRLLLEALDPREMFAVLNVVAANPLPGEFTSIQAAVNNAAPGDTIKIGATPVQGGFAESVNLSLMGSALAGGAQTGNLTIIGDASGAGTTIIPPATTTSNGTAFYNSAPFTGDLVFDRLSLRPAIATAGEDKGIKLTGVTGNIKITNTQVFDAVDAGIEILYSGGSSGSQSRIILEDVGISSNGTVPTVTGILLADVSAWVSLDHVTITETSVAVTIATTSATTTSVMLRDVDVDVWSDELRGEDGVRISALGSSNLNVSFAFCDFLDVPSNSIDASVGDTARLAVNVYENSRFGNTDTSLVRTPGEAVAKFVSRNSGRLSVGMDHNIFDGLGGNAILLQALDTSVMNANIFENFMTSMGTTTSDKAISILGNATANATVNARIEANEIFDPLGTAIYVVGNGTSTYNVGIHNNNIMYGLLPPATVAGVDILGVSGQLAKMNIASRGNTIDGVTNSIRVNQVSSNVQLKYESAIGPGVGSIESYLLANNTINRAVVSVFNELNVVMTTPGTFTPRLPLRIGDFVWSDTNKNGLQDAGELAVGGVLLSLTGTETLSGATVNQTILSDGDHGYLFGAMLPGTYTITLTPPTGFDLTGLKRATPLTTDNNNEFDSDYRQGIRQATVTLASGVDNMDLDAGLVPTNGKVWMNQLLSADVNDDGVVAPLDALLVIIDLNANGSRALTAPTADRSPAPFVDVNGDGFLAPLDALQVIIYLNSGGASEGQGEPALDPIFADASPVPLAPVAIAAAPAINPAKSSPAATPIYFAPEFFYGSAAAQQSTADTDDDAAAIDAFFANWNN